MKKLYEEPQLDIERFIFEDITTGSEIGGGDGKPDLEGDGEEQLP